MKIKGKLAKQKMKKTPTAKTKMMNNSNSAPKDSSVMPLALPTGQAATLNLVHQIRMIQKRMRIPPTTKKWNKSTIKESVSLKSLHKKEKRESKMSRQSSRKTSRILMKLLKIVMI